MSAHQLLPGRSQGADARATLAAGELQRQVVGALGLQVFASDDCGHWNFQAAAADPAFQAAVAAKLPAWCDMPTSYRDLEVWIRAYDQDPKPCPELPPHLTMGAAPPEAWCYDATEARAAVERCVKQPGGCDLSKVLRALGLRFNENHVTDPTAVLEILRRFVLPEPEEGEEPPTFADLAGFLGWVLSVEDGELKECAEDANIAAAPIVTRAVSRCDDVGAASESPAPSGDSAATPTQHIDRCRRRRVDDDRRLRGRSGWSRLLDEAGPRLKVLAPERRPDEDLQVGQAS